MTCGAVFWCACLANKQCSISSICAAGTPERARTCEPQRIERAPKPSPCREDGKLCLPDEVFPDVTHHGNFVSATLDQHHGGKVTFSSGAASHAVRIPRPPHPSRRTAAPPSPHRQRQCMIASEAGLAPSGPPAALSSRPAAADATTDDDNPAGRSLRGCLRVSAVNCIRGGPCPLGLPCCSVTPPGRR